jgi:nitrite reductase/ring-hydroxylating ferredoxin subunit
MSPDTPSPLLVPTGDWGDQGKSYHFIRKGWDVEAIVYAEDDGIRVFINRCPHLPLTLDIGSGSFFTKRGDELLCSNHGARFARSDGACTWGPCTGYSLIPIPHSWSDDKQTLHIHIDRIDQDRPSRQEVLGEE